MPTPFTLVAELAAELVAETSPQADLPAPHPSSFGPLALPAPGQVPELVLLAAVGLSAERLSRLWAARNEQGFDAALVSLGDRLATRAPRLLRQLTWQLLREEPRRAQALVDAFVSQGAFAQPGALSLLLDLAEESPRAYEQHGPALLAALLKEDLADPLDPTRHLSDLLCLADLPPAFVKDGLAPVWQTAPTPRARSVLMRLCVFHRALPLCELSGKLAERIHHPKTRYQAYSYRLYADGTDYRVIDLTRTLQQNGSELPKYAPSMYLRRMVGQTVAVRGFVDRAADDPTLLVRDLIDPRDAPTQSEEKTKAREPKARQRATGPVAPDDPMPTTVATTPTTRD